MKEMPMGEAGFGEEHLCSFPRQRLDILIPRRGLLASVVSEIHAISEKEGGKPVYNMAGLGLLSDEELETIAPVLVEGCRIYEEQETIYCSSPKWTEPVRLFPADSPVRIVLSRFDGQRTLKQISWSLVKYSKYDHGQSFAFTRGVFLQSVIMGFFRPG